MRLRRLARLASLVFLAVGWPLRALHGQQRTAEAGYVPGPQGGWESRRPRQLGMDSARVAAAVAFALASETRSPRDLLLAHVQSFGREPFGDAIGPFAARGDPTGLIIRRVEGTKRPCRLAPNGMAEIDQWLGMLRQALARSYDRLDDVLAAMPTVNKTKKRKAKS